MPKWLIIVLALLGAFCLCGGGIGYIACKGVTGERDAAIQFANDTVTAKVIKGWNKEEFIKNADESILGDRDALDKNFATFNDRFGAYKSTTKPWGMEGINASTNNGISRVDIELTGRMTFDKGEYPVRMSLVKRNTGGWKILGLFVNNEQDRTK